MQNTTNYNLNKPDGTDYAKIQALNQNADIIDTQLKNLNDNKVDKVSGKQLSTNDYTSAEKTKLSGIATGANKTTVNNTLTSTSTTDALSAAQGNQLKVLLDTKASVTEMDSLNGIIGQHTDNNAIHLSPGDVSRLANSMQKVNEGYNGDPDTTLDGYILTETGNVPSPGFWHIWTNFYSSVAPTSNRVQRAANYITGELATRVYRNGWSPWRRYGDPTTLLTTNKDYAGAINELFQSVSNGKSLVANAIRLQGVPTADNAEFATMASNIGKINSGASGTGQLSSSALSFRYYETTNTLNFYNLTVSGLNFKPRFITAYYKRGSLNYQAVYNNVNLAESVSTYGFGGAETTGVIRHLKMGVSSGYVNSTGFRIPIVSTSDVTSSDQGTINWYAFP